VDLCLRRSAQCVLHLVDRARHDHPEGEGDHADQHHVVDQEAQPAWDAGPREPLDPRPQGRGQDEGEENEGEDELQLPER
jgi:hypothetical protein